MVYHPRISHNPPPRRLTIMATPTPLSKIITEKISTDGAMPIDVFMALSLTHAEHGYYIKHNPFGSDGDFITAPEISQIFGELLGLWCFDQLHQQGLIDHVELVELGPGRGTLMADMLRAIMPFSGDKSWPIHLLEISPRLRALQQEKLKNYDITHIDDLSALPPRPIVFIANEFFDALPVRQFERRTAINGDSAWHERVVDYIDGALKFSTIPHDICLALPSTEDNVIADGTVVALAPVLPQIITQIAHHITAYGGAALIVDYGSDNPFGDSLQAVQDHRPVDVLASPGAADISAWVDFSAIRRAAISAGATVVGPTPQGDFLKSLGLYHRAEQLGINANPKQRRMLAAAVDRLSSPAQMGQIFNVMVILPLSNQSE